MPKLHSLIVLYLTQDPTSKGDRCRGWSDREVAALRLRALPERETRGDDGDARHRVRRHQQEDSRRVEGEGNICFINCVNKC